MRVGFVGLGNMGRHMARNVLEAGYDVIAYDIDPAALEWISEHGAGAASNTRAVAESSDVLISMLPRPQDVEALLLTGTDPLCEVLRPGSTHVDMSTGDPFTATRIAEELARRGIDAIDCPVGRTAAHAESGTLLLLAGGPTECIDRVRPVLMCMGNQLIICGDSGAGQTMKLVNNMLCLTVTKGVGEALSMGMSAGLPLETICNVTTQTMAQTAELDVALPATTFRGNLTPGFALSLAEKDVRLAVEVAERLGVAVPLASETLRYCEDLLTAGHGGDDVGILVAKQTQAAGLDLSTLMAEEN